MPRIGFYGASGEVTGSNFLVETSSHKYVVDCGLFQGRDTISEHNDQPFTYHPAEVNAAIITHAHLDHIGRLPKLVREGFRGPIYATKATIELSTIVLKDALDLGLQRHQRENKPLLYEQVDLNRTLSQFEPVEYHKKHKLFDDDWVTLYDAGHILGSASVELEAEGKKIVFSGDIGHWPSTLLPVPQSPEAADAVVMEATYGGQEHHDADRLKTIKEALVWTAARKGTLLIPAFSIERTQELLYLLNELFMHHQLPNMPIFLDSPLAIEALEVFKRHQELFAQEVQKVRAVDRDVFDFAGLVLTSAVEDSKDINRHPGPKVIIAGSGMMVGGRIVHHLKHYLSHPETYLLVIGYQAPGTLGSAILGGAKTVEIMGDRIPIKAKIEKAEAFSGHADSSQLIEWVRRIKLSEHARAVIVHSDPKRATVFQQSLATHLPDLRVIIAGMGSQLEL